MGVKGIFQWFRPQYATGVGLVRYGAAELAEQAMRAGEQRIVEPRQMAAEIRTGAKGSSIWEWVRAAF